MSNDVENKLAEKLYLVNLFWGNEISGSVLDISDFDPVLKSLGIGKHRLQRRENGCKL